MQTVDKQPETIHLYVVREEAPKPQLLPIFLSVLALASLVALSTAVPYEQPVTRAVIRVPAVPLSFKTFTAKVAVIPTGVKFYPATTARGILTITNGSVIAQVIPAGFTIQHVATDMAVYVPAGSANGYGYATVTAHALVNGKGGNFATLVINQVIGSSVYIRNLSAFSGGRDAYSVTYVTEQDRQTAIKQARSQLTTTVIGLHYPCTENLFGVSTKMTITWHCQFVTYHVPSYMCVLRVRLIGKNLLIDVAFMPPLVRMWVK